MQRLEPGRPLLYGPTTGKAATRIDRPPTGRAAVYQLSQAFGIGLCPATNPDQPVTLTDLDKPADLTLWPGHAPARTARTRSFPSLRAALAAAAEAMDAEDARAWIITESGDILAPGWIRANAGSRRPQ